MRKSLNTKTLGLFFGPLLFVLILLFFHPVGLSKEANAILASTAWIAVWWITEAIPIAVTSLLPIILFPLTGGLSLNQTTASFGHRYIFLYIGGFILAIAIERWNLHRRIALNIINLIGTNVKRIILGFMAATAFLSMWISNTATTVMMLPIGMAIVSQLQDNPATAENENRTFGKVLMLAIAYSASIGGLATLIGTPPNLVFAGIMEETYGIEINFAQWIQFGLPISLLLLVICWKYLTEVAYKFKQQAFPGGREEIKRQLQALGRIGREEKTVLAVFAATAFLWIIRSPVQKFVETSCESKEVYQPLFIAKFDDTIIAMMAGIVLFLLPAAPEKKRAIIQWDEAVKLPWGILLLFGGGLALAQGFKISGLAQWLGEQMTLAEGISVLMLLLFIVTAVNFLTEITSNLATTSMMLPILVLLAEAIDVHPYLLTVGATVAASCAFMLPVATPPNAIVFGSGYLKIPVMVRAGIWMNILSIIILTAFTFFLLPYLWDFDPAQFPLDWERK